MSNMRTMVSEGSTSNAKRLLYNTELSLQVVAACAHRGESMTVVALQLDIKFDSEQFERTQRDGGRPYDLRSTGSFVVCRTGLR